MTKMFDRDAGRQAVDAVSPKERENAFKQLEPYHGKTNSWGKRASLISSVGFLRQRYANAPCDSEAVADCNRCITMSLVRTMERLLAATGGADAPL